MKSGRPFSSQLTTPTFAQDVREGSPVAERPGESAFTKRSVNRWTRALRRFDDKSALSDFHHLVTFFERFLGTKLKLFESYTHGTQKRVSFEDLWMLFDIGQVVYSPRKKGGSNSKPLEPFLLVSFLPACCIKFHYQHIVSFTPLPKTGYSYFAKNVYMVLLNFVNKQYSPKPVKSKSIALCKWDALKGIWLLGPLEVPL